jgi:hypothetical protein
MNITANFQTKKNNMEITANIQTLSSRVQSYQLIIYDSISNLTIFLFLRENNSILSF